MCPHLCVLFPPLISFHGGRKGTAEPKYFSWHRLFYNITGSFPTLLSAVNIFENNFFLLNSIQCWLPAIFKNSSNSISSPSKNIFALSTDISSIFGIRIDWYEMLNKLFFRSFDSTWGQCRNLRCLWSPLLKFGYSTKAWLPDFCRNPLHCSASTLWSEISLGRL